MASQDLADDSLKKLVLSNIQQKCFPIEDDVVSRLAQSCTRLQHLQLTGMFELTEEARMSVGGLVREIIQKNPPLTHLNLD